jgi:hypothetical protein
VDDGGQTRTGEAEAGGEHVATRVHAGRSDLRQDGPPLQVEVGVADRPQPGNGVAHARDEVCPLLW